MKLNVTQKHLKYVKEILKKHIPNSKVWAFGSRVKGNAKEFSDLDLAIVSGAPIPLSQMIKINDDFSESDIPYKVDILDWNAISPEFQKVIKSGYLIIQDPSSENKGFSLVQIMVAVGLLGMIAVGVMQVSKQMQSTTVSGETSLEENQLINHISTILIDADSCRETFKNLELGKPVESIKRTKSTGEKLEVYKTGQNYGNRTLLLKAMTLEGPDGEEHLDLTIERIKAAYSGVKEIKKKIPLKLVIKDGKVTDCFNDLSNVTENSIKKACESVGAEYDSSTQKCKNLKININEAQLCEEPSNCKNVKNYIEDLIVEVNKKSTLCIIKYNPLLGFVNNRLELATNKCFANKADGASVSCTLNAALTDCN